MSQKKQTGPLQNIFIDIKKILDKTVFKNEALAKENETPSSAGKAELYILAMKNQDSYITYKNWWTIDMFNSVYHITTNEFEYYMENPFSVPLKYRDTLLIKGRESFFVEFEEENAYYRMLMGLPPIDTTDYIKLSPELAEEYGVNPETPVHELSVYVQNKYMETDEYAEVVANNPDKEYLLYIGSNKLELYTIRTAKDFDIIKYPVGRTDVNAYVLSEFPKLYADAREYIMVILYNKQFESLYVGYREFMGFLILSYALMLTCNKAVDGISAHRYMDDTMIYTTLSTYNIPDSLLLTNDVRRNLALHIARLIKEKGTDDAYYDIMEILGYQDVTVSKLMLMKGEKNETTGDYEPYFLQMDIKEDNLYEAIVNNRTTKHTYEEVTENDPSWWEENDGEESAKEKLGNSEFSETESKYIVLEATIHQLKSMFESIYFTRMILDNPETHGFMISIPEIFQKEQVSLYDCIVYLICATCMANNLSGEIYTKKDKLLATAGFNFDIDMTAFMDFVNNSKYLDKDWLTQFTSNLAIQDSSDINRVFNNVIYPLREWLEDKMARTSIREEFLEYEAVYRALFTYDITRNKILDDFKMPMDVIKDTYNLTDDDLTAFKYFYPHTEDGRTITVDTYDDSDYSRPFISYGNEITWHVKVEIDAGEYDGNRGELYLYDLLNYDDARCIPGRNGLLFMDKTEDDAYELNEDAVQAAREKIAALSDEELSHAYFQIRTKKSDETYYEAGEQLPDAIKTSVFKSILLDKLNIDTDGLAQPPETYFEYLRRHSTPLYDLLVGNAPYPPFTDSAWLNNVNTVMVAMENELGVHVKYLEQSVVGNDLFFEPLITLIKHFKSLLVDITQTGIKYMFDDKMDIGGNSNMLKLFDEMNFAVHFTTFANTGYTSELGLFDTMHKAKFHIELNDKTRVQRYIVGEGFAAEEKIIKTGSIQMIDEVKCFKNGKPLDDPDGSMWRTGEPGAGRWSDEEDTLMKAREKNIRIHSEPVDIDGWKDFVPVD